MEQSAIDLFGALAVIPTRAIAPVDLREVRPVKTGVSSQTRTNDIHRRAPATVKEDLHAIAPLSETVSLQLCYPSSRTPCRALLADARCPQTLDLRLYFTVGICSLIYAVSIVSLFSFHSSGSSHTTFPCYTIYVHHTCILCRIFFIMLIEDTLAELTKCDRTG